MNRSDSPKKQPKPFGVNGQRVAILPTTPAGDNSASYEQGFPPITMILKSAGGLPPKGQDMNQILYELSALGRWSSTGALNTFDSEFASEISGYPSGAMLISNDGERIFINTTEGNLSDPNSNGTGWKDILSYLGLGEAAKRDVGTGENQIPDMGAFTSGSGWFRIPSGYIVQFGTFRGNTDRVISGSFPIPFPNQPSVSVGFMSDYAQSTPEHPTKPVLSVNFEHISNSEWRAATSDLSQQFRFGYISIGR
ncbi:phage tail protein [Escherichia coli]|nr:phage tail protein [Escherichia coli]